MLTTNRCMHGMIADQCGICLRMHERLFGKKVTPPPGKEEAPKRKKARA